MNVADAPISTMTDFEDRPWFEPIDRDGSARTWTLRFGPKTIVVSDDELDDAYTSLMGLDSCGLVVLDGPITLRFAEGDVLVHDRDDTIEAMSDLIDDRDVRIPDEIDADEMATIDHDALRAAWGQHDWPGDTSYNTLRRLIEQWYINGVNAAYDLADAACMSPTGDGIRSMSAGSILNGLLGHGWLAVTKRPRPYQAHAIIALADHARTTGAAPELIAALDRYIDEARLRR